MLPREEALAALQAAPDVVKVAFRVDGGGEDLQLDSRVVLLDAVRERPALTGSKKGGDQRTVRMVIVDGGGCCRGRP